jgi:hypothetical protein
MSAITATATTVDPNYHDNGKSAALARSILKSSDELSHGRGPWRSGRPHTSNLVQAMRLHGYSARGLSEETVLSRRLRLTRQTRRSFWTGELIISHRESVVEWDQSVVEWAQDRGAAMAAALAPVQVSVAAEWVSRYSPRLQALQGS